MEAGASSTTGERTDGSGASMAGETSPMRPTAKVRRRAGTGPVFVVRRHLWHDDGLPLRPAGRCTGHTKTAQERLVAAVAVIDGIEYSLPAGQLARVGEGLLQSAGVKARIFLIRQGSGGLPG